MHDARLGRAARIMNIRVENRGVAFGAMPRGAVELRTASKRVCPEGGIQTPTALACVVTWRLLLA